MVNTSEGLTPTLRPALGVGWNRVLPAPFGFSNGWQPDGANDYFAIPTLKIDPMPIEVTIEFWLKTGAIPTSGTNRTLFSFLDSTAGYVVLINLNSTGSWATIQSQLRQNNVSIGSIGEWGSIFPNSVAHCVFNFSKLTGTYSVFVNSIAVGGGVSSFLTNSNWAKWDVVQFRDPFTTSIQYPYPHKYDEFRLYNKRLTYPEILLAYNNGIGNNPSNTENLVCWYDFNKGEAAGDLWPGGIPAGWIAGSWGIRDKTNNNFHAMQVNMANNDTMGGKLIPF